MRWGWQGEETLYTDGLDQGMIGYLDVVSLSGSTEDLHDVYHPPVPTGDCRLWSRVYVDGFIRG